MIWSKEPQFIEESIARLGAAEMLRTTDIAHNGLPSDAVEISPVNYFIIPRAAHEIGRLVVAFVNLHSNGLMNRGAPSVFGVTESPAMAADLKTDAIYNRLLQVHVLAEYQSLRYGIKTPYGRHNAEIEVSRYIPEAYRPVYAADRVAHLAAIAEEVYASDELTSDKEIIINELDLARRAMISLSSSSP